MKMALAVLLAATLSSSAQAPSKDTIVLSLKTMNKALSGCRMTYAQRKENSTEPLLRNIIGSENYDKDLMSLGHAEKITSFLIAHPDQISGKSLVMILSTSDDFSVGVGSTRAAILTRFVDPASKVSGGEASSYAAAAASLDVCQKNIFNAGDDYVDLVFRFVGAEDDALARRPNNR
jgi:hypothetical protein